MLMTRNPSTRDVTPPDIPLEKKTFDVRYPQAEPSLPRIQAPLPFPRTLLDTLSHTAAYVDQAGYLAKYAVGVRIAFIQFSFPMKSYLASA